MNEWINGSVNHWFLLTLVSESDYYYQLEEVEDIKIQSKRLLKGEKSQSWSQKKKNPRSSDAGGEAGPSIRSYIYSFTHSVRMLCSPTLSRHWGGAGVAAS